MRGKYFKKMIPKKKIDLLTHLDLYFDRNSTQRGTTYFIDGQVEFLEGAPLQEGTLAFAVRGTKTYSCFLSDSEFLRYKKILGTCSCPYFEKKHFCKHLWACIMKAHLDDLFTNIFPCEDRISFDVMPPPRDINLPTPPPQWKKIIDQIHPSQPIVSTATRKAYYATSINRPSHPLREVYITPYYKKISKVVRGKDVIHDKICEKDIKHFDQRDQAILRNLLSIQSGGDYWYDYDPIKNVPIPPELTKFMLTEMANTGHLYWEQNLPQKPLKFAGDQCKLSIYVTEQEKGHVIDGIIKKGEWKQRISKVKEFTSEGTFLGLEYFGAIRFEDIPWFLILKSLAGQFIPHEDGSLLIKTLYSHPNAPPISWPKSLQWDKISQPPTPQMVIDQKPDPSGKNFYVHVNYNYGSETVSALAPSGKYAVDTENQLLYHRDPLEESQLLSRLEQQQGMQLAPRRFQDEYHFRFHHKKFAQIVEEALNEGWQVMAYGKKVHTPSHAQTHIKSGIDWFDLEGKLHFSDSFSLSFSELIPLLNEKKEKLIPLGNDRFVMLPKTWLEKYGRLAEMGEKKGESIRFNKSQGILLDAYLNESESTFDLDFQKFQSQLRKIKLQKEKQPSKYFKGDLRGYQKVGLAWLDYLDQFEIGGILADDMGVGKTVQVLAFLQDLNSRKKVKETRLPHLIVVPKSLVLNWKEEIEKFTPNLKAIPYVGSQRNELTEEIPQSDIVITTYHILKRDFPVFSEQSFHYVILDEAQAIKNPGSQISRVCKKIPSKKRLALTGTPVENSLLDLFSIMDFVNPRLINNKLKNQFTKSSLNNNKDDIEIAPLQRALSPMILRRSKEEVLSDIPPKTVSTLHCELSKKEQKKYDDLKLFYQTGLSKKFSTQGFKQSKIQVLEALLRLRQAACDINLIDKKKHTSRSAKVETLLEKVKELIAGEHKCLVFSQFTSLLKIVQEALNEEKIDYCYLDGSTNNRQDIVKRFQVDSKLKVFLISLKAGGVGLNLTEADYVFILDPWWNPAVEMQAIDRAHRIGQKKNVIAYKIIAKGTVEEKILKLQEQKRKISDSIVNSDTGMLKKMTQEDLNFLLE